jgi:hypothetical protein
MDMFRRWILFLCFTACLAFSATAEEGFWLYNYPPTTQVKTRYGFTLTQSWLDHLRLSSVRFNNGGSGSFVSADGLTFTNHHVAQTCLYGLSTKDRDLYKTGFYAETQEKEAKCPDLELNVLVGIVDVTGKVDEGITSATPTAEAATKRRGNMASLESECVKSSGLRCDVVTLYAGGMYHLYKYKKYTDVRLVFAPEFDAAFFGGDPDNFEFPRYDLDITFFRVYENGTPAHTSQYLKWSTAGVKEDDLIFESGHPGSTGRLLTYDQLQFLRDESLPLRLEFLSRRVKLLKEYSARGPEFARQAQESLFGYQNSYKAVHGYESGLLDNSLMATKAAEEKKLKSYVAQSAQNQQKFGDPWSEISQAITEEKKIFLQWTLLERRSGGDLSAFAREIVRAAAERPKPNIDRLREYRETALPSLEQSLFAASPVYKSLESAFLADWLTELKQKLPGDPAVKQLLEGKDPAALAKQIIQATTLDNPEVRKTLYEGGKDAVAASNDPLLTLAKTMDSEARAARKEYEDQVDAVEQRNGTKLAQIRFALQGTSVSPDATFTLRLSYGKVKGYVEDGRGSVAAKGKQIPYFTTMGGAYEHAAAHGSVSPYQLPDSWIKAKSKLSLNTPLDIVSTVDCIGGNSGSPIVNSDGKIVGIIFDGNIQSLPWDYLFDDTTGRSVFVDARGITEALRTVYNANRVVDELTKTEPSKKSILADKPQK